MKQLFFLLSVLFLIASCEDIENGPAFAFTADNECYLPDTNPVSRNEFEANVIGHGWICTEGYLILPDGSCERELYWLKYVGACVPDLYIGTDSIKSYFDYALKPVGAYTHDPYTLTDPVKYINIETRGERLRILTIGDTEMTGILGSIETPINKEDYRKGFVYAKFRKMTDTQLEAINKEYNYKVTKQ